MLEELPGSDETSLIPTLLLHLYVAVPEAIIIVIKVNRHLTLVLLLHADAPVVGLSVRLPVEICHACLCLSVHLVLFDVQVRVIEFLTLFVSISAVDASHHLFQEGLFVLILAVQSTGEELGDLILLCRVVHVLLSVRA